MRIFFYVWEFQALFFCVECSWVCLHGTVRSISCIYVVAQAPRNRRSPPVPCHGCKSHKSTQSRGISPSARTTIIALRYRRAWPVHCIHIIVDRLCFKSSCYHPQHIAKDTIENQFLCHATAAKSRKNLLKAEESRRLHVLQHPYSVGEPSVFTVYIL